MVSSKQDTSMQRALSRTRRISRLILSSQSPKTTSVSLSKLSSRRRFVPSCIVYFVSGVFWLWLLLLSDETTVRYLQSESESRYLQDTYLQLSLENRNTSEHAASPELCKPVENQEQESGIRYHPLARQNQTTLTVNVTATDKTRTLRPCRVAVTNSYPARLSFSSRRAQFATISTKRTTMRPPKH